MIAIPLLAVLVQTLSGAPVDALQAPAGTKAIVYIFTSTDCPISNRYAPEIRRLAETFRPKGVSFRMVYPSRAETPDAIRAHLGAFSYDGVTEAVRDPELALVKFTGATITPEAVVFDPAGRRLYRGRIDDRYVDFGRARPAPTRRDLRDALDATLAGKPVQNPTTKAIGCFIPDK